MTTIGFYFPLPKNETNELRARLNKLAKDLGYVATRGPTAGQGNLSAMLVALDAGKLTIEKKDAPVISPSPPVPG